ncbi:uncharacterized protein FA14DRAFT_17410 [Meira miltonrushii]|uniref:Haem-binding uptake Tiki superfamily ChaN domain-containing protein n=1 Tax=Meira miltonrushii TaxID=1280837 RepID=A0A316VJ79_9BASI|nr:uncharacterized protein FA14DRAFT_17410 [Meira miltonrushii]PWN37672.1 hypothetical protein FA14DRAFT_17410 [Meira miltonrushii]
MARIASMIARLTPPVIVQGDILPSFGRICRTNHEGKAEETIPFSQANTSLKDLAPIHNPTLEKIVNSALKQDRVIFFGEQHHQPKVLSSQLQVIHQIWHSARKRAEEDSKPEPKLHIVFEQWSLEDQPFLHKINKAQTEEASELFSKSEEVTSEGFSFNHYALLIKLAREMGANVWGGFPPRTWARIIARGGSVEGDHAEKPSKDSHVAFDEIQKLDQERFEASLSALNLAEKDAETKQLLIPPLSTEQYKQIGQVSWAHRTYLKGMFAPDKRPLIPSEATAGQDNPLERVGFTPAQALKDTFFAHTISTILERDPNNIVIAICGLGHCEWRFGAPERLRGNAQPYIIVSKPNDSGFWPENTVENTEHDSNSTPSSHQQKGEEWQRKQADAILLYDWVD